LYHFYQNLTGVLFNHAYIMIMNITEEQVDNWLEAHGYHKVKNSKKGSPHPLCVRVIRAGEVIETRPFNSLKLAFENYKDRLSGGTGVTGDHFHNFRSMVNKKADSFPYNIVVLNNYAGEALRVYNTEFITEEKSVDLFGPEKTKQLAAIHFFALRGRGGKLLNAEELATAQQKLANKFAQKS
jgi:hypothetical protein